jgi:inner membrane protein
MFIAHFPAGYLGACAIESCLPSSISISVRRKIFRAFVLGSILPDLDMFYFYWIDRQQHLHHEYWTHLPIFWLAVYGVVLAQSRLSQHPNRAIVATAFLAGIFLHLFLDTPTGGIAWFYPVSDTLIYWVTVPAQYDWWVWNFVLHWTFWVEVLLCLGSVYLYWHRHTRKATE